MKKNLIKGMVALCICAAFTSCSKDPGFETPDYAEISKIQYKEAFIKKYGEIDPNQSWDFTNLSSVTRADASWSKISCGKGFFQSFIDNDADAVHNGVATAPVLEWNPALKVEMYPCYAHGYEYGKDMYFHIGIIDKDKSYLYKNIPYIDVFGNVKTKDDQWYGAGNTLIHDSGRRIDAKGIGSSNQIWVAYWTWADNSSSQPKADNNSNMANLKSFEIKNYKELIVGEHTYWCFDCNRDGNYSDYICLVENVDPVKPIIKRYMVEDLGAIGDFDFNDIVVDVKEDIYGHQSAIVRAMGGTLKFTLKIGDTQWEKSSYCDYTRMVNTLPTIDWGKSDIQFTVTGWDPSTDNITVYVERNDKTTNNTDVITEIPFPKKGEVPMIIAVDPLQYWMPEYQSLPDGWWTEPIVEE